MQKIHHQAIYLAIVSSLFVISCSDEGTDTSRTCNTGYEMCGSLCCTSGSCVNDVCHDSDNSSCGAQEIQCGEHQQCTKGECVDVETKPASCHDGQKLCDDTCVDVKTDSKHCGDCSTVCSSEETCQNGVCQKAETECGSDYTFIDGQCIDILSDSSHCGAPHQACPDNTYCSEGKCICDDGFYDCDKDESNGCESKGCDLKCNPGEDTCAENDECVDILSNAAHCGKCGNTCKDDESCIMGSCAPNAISTCEDNQLLCFGTCVNYLTDDANCGECLNACGEGTKCESGHCEIQCGELDKCGDTCVDLETDSSHCGTCETACLAGQTCQSGKCDCDSTHFDCDGDIANGCESTEKCSCTPGEKRACWRGEEKNVIRDKEGNLTEAKGICELGEQICDSSGAFWGTCTGGVYPSSLTCNEFGVLNGLDNDCDGETDTVCRGACELEAGEMSYIGCEYWGAYLDNLITDGTSNFTFVFSNPGELTSTIYIFDHNQSENASTQPVQTISLASHAVKVVKISGQAYNMSKGSGIYNNAYRIRATHPITAYQFSPFGSANAHSNDASLLLPANVLGKNYIGMTWHSDSGNDHRSYLAVIATQPGKTDVTIKTTATVSQTDNQNVYNINGKQVSQTKIDQMKSGSTKTFSLNRFDVLTLMAPASSAENQTGTTINANQNIAVFGGSRASYVPSGAIAKCCRDHIEEQLFPTQAWGKSYYAARAYSTGKAGDFWLITARDNDTTVTLPANLKDRNGKNIGGSFKLSAGQTREVFETRENFEIQADKPISVGQFLPSQQYNGLSIGDPSFILTVPYEQYRKDYDFVVSKAFDVDYLTIVKPQNAKIILDNKEIQKYISDTEIGTTGFSVAYINIADGVHHISSTEAFGLYSYGYFNMSSYGYPIGLDLKILNTN